MTDEKEKEHGRLQRLQLNQLGTTEFSVYLKKQWDGYIIFVIHNRVLPNQLSNDSCFLTVDRTCFEIVKAQLDF